LRGSLVHPIDQDIADAVFAAANLTAAAGQTGTTEITTRNIARDDAGDNSSADEAWESLATSWNFWPVLANA
jgi:hypothetical protein